MQYKNYKTEDFLLDDAFIAWVKHQENDAFWQRFLSENPKQEPIVAQAKNMILAARPHINDKQLAQLKSRIFEQIEAEEKPVSLKQTWYGVWRWAAAVASIAVLVWFFYPKNAGNTEGVKIAYQDLVKKAETELVEVFNEKDKPQLVLLDDKSSVLLQKGSRISYPKNINVGSNRTVYLSGEAFFEVAKNPEKPFFVYANELVTKVLGTSFNISAYSNDKNVVVTVKTGKVTVFSNKQKDKQVGDEKSRNREGVVLTPNQQIIFNRAESEILKSLVQVPVVQNLSVIQKQRFDFDDMPIDKVFETLEKAYNLDIVYDEELMSTCKITATMTDEPFFEKLRLICLTIEASYQIIDAQVVIQSKGCKKLF